MIGAHEESRIEKEMFVCASTSTQAGAQEKEGQKPT